MNVQHEMCFKDVFIQQHDDKCFKNADVQLKILRLDKIHPVISGNKWFKLKYHLDNFNGKMDDDEVNGKLNGGGVLVRVNAGSGRIYLGLK